MVINGKINVAKDRGHILDHIIKVTKEPSGRDEGGTTVARDMGHILDCCLVIDQVGFRIINFHN